MSDKLRLPSDKEMEVLRLLIGKREMYGLEMVKASKNLPRGTIYVTLSRMIDKGFLKSRAVDDSNVPGLPRQLYTITGEGYRAYEARRAAQNALLGVVAEGAGS